MAPSSTLGAIRKRQGFKQQEELGTMPRYEMPFDSHAAMVEFAKLDEFTRAYVECAMWVGIDEEEEIAAYGAIGNAPFDDLAPEALASMIEDCAEFQAAHAADIGDAASQAGHDYWLTRNGHGAGFWDRSESTYGTAESRDRLNVAAEHAGPRDLYIGDDGKIYIA